MYTGFSEIRLLKMSSVNDATFFRFVKAGVNPSEYYTGINRSVIEYGKSKENLLIFIIKRFANQKKRGDKDEGYS